MLILSTFDNGTFKPLECLLWHFRSGPGVYRLHAHSMLAWVPHNGVADMVNSSYELFVSPGHIVEALLGQRNESNSIVEYTMCYHFVYQKMQISFCTVSYRHATQYLALVADERMMQDTQTLF